MLAKILLIVLALQAGPSDPLSGPLTDAISRRLDKIAERVESHTGLFDRLYDRLDESHGRRLREIAGDMQLAKAERSTLLKEFRKWNDERDGLIASIASARSAAIEAREQARLANKEAREARREALAMWTPFQNLAKRGIWLIAYLFVLILAALALWEFAKWALVRVMSGLFSFRLSGKAMKTASIFLKFGFFLLVWFVVYVCMTSVSSAQTCVNCREVNQWQVVKTPSETRDVSLRQDRVIARSPTPAPPLPMTASPAAVPMRIASASIRVTMAPARVLARGPQVVQRQPPVVQHINCRPMVSILERPVRVFVVPRGLLHRARFGCH